MTSAARAQYRPRPRARNCSKCGNIHYDAFRMCAVCREHGRIRNELWRADHIKRKLCVRCNEYHAAARRSCGYHLEYDNERVQRTQAEQLAMGLCSVGRCPAALVNAWYCEHHAALHYAARQRWAAKNAARQRSRRSTPQARGRRRR